MTAEDSIKKLESLDRKIPFSGTPFLQIAGIIRKQEAVRLAALKAVGRWLNEGVGEPSDDPYLAHRILATGEPDGILKGGSINSANDPTMAPK